MHIFTRTASAVLLATVATAATASSIFSPPIVGTKPVLVGVGGVIGAGNVNSRAEADAIRAAAKAQAQAAREGAKAARDAARGGH